MSGYKTTIKSYFPKMLLTFDGDAFNANKTLAAVPAVIIDESEFDNNGLLLESGTTFYGHRLDMPSLVLQEPAGRSISFGYYGRQPGGNPWEKGYIEVPHSSSLAFNDFDGAFSVVFLYKKELNGSYYRANEPGASSASFSRPIISKSGVFNLTVVYQFGNFDYLNLDLPDGKNLRYTLPSDFHGVGHLIAFTWNPVTTDSGKVCIGTFYVDGVIVATASYPYFAAFPTTNFATPVYIGGSTTNTGNFNDRATDSTLFDQVAIFNEALSAGKISRLLRKIYSYQEMILLAKPNNYWPCQDAETPNNSVLVPLVGSSSATGIGGITRFTRGVPGPTNIPGSVAASIQNAGQLLLSNTFIPMTQDYTVSFEFAATSNQAALLFTSAGTQRPFNGITVLLNTFNNQFQSGAIQVQESEDEFASFSGNYNDGQYHTFVIIKRGTVCECWVDGIKRVQFSASSKSSSNNEVSIFSNSPGKRGTDGKICHIAIYRYALSETQILSQSNFSKIYKIRGAVSLRGAPYKANVRLYSHETGEKIQEIFSDVNTGEYLAELYDGRKIDMMILNPQDQTIKYRVYGPVTPSEYEDLSTD